MATLIVEDGTGRSDANAIIALADFKSYCADRGRDVSAYTDEQLNEAIIRASSFLANAFVWDGSKVNRRAQTMPFPRYGVTDREGWPVLPPEIPRELTAACAEIAYAEAVTPGAMNPTMTPGTLVRVEQVGPIRTEYANLFNSPNDWRPVLLVVQDLLWGFLANGGPNAICGTSYRG